MEPLRHQCMIYEGSPVEFLPVTASLIARRLSHKRRCLYLNSPAMVAGLRSYLAAAGVDVDEAISEGSLVLSSDLGHLVAGAFDVERMLALISDAVDEAVGDGYLQLFATGDMTWEFGPERDFGKLGEYEQRLEQMFHSRRELEAVCQYHADTLPPEAVADGFYSHRGCFINESLSVLNPYYRAPGSGPQDVTPPEEMNFFMADGGRSTRPAAGARHR